VYIAIALRSSTVAVWHLVNTPTRQHMTPLLTQSVEMYQVKYMFIIASPLHLYMVTRSF